MLADIPGLVAGASEGTGLGDRFLAHIERTRALVYVVDVSDGPEAVAAALRTVARELGSFSAGLGARPAVVVLNKTDLVDADIVAAATRRVASLRRFAGAPVLATSAVAGEGLEPLAPALLGLLRRADAEVAAEAAEERIVTVLRPGGDRVGDYSIERDGDVWRVHGAAIERLVAKADLDNEEAVRYLQEVMEHAGLSKAVRHAGGADGDTIVIGESEFELA